MIQSTYFVFVYRKDEVIKCLEFEQSLENDKQLKNDGWLHIATINPCIFIENLNNELKLIYL